MVLTCRTDSWDFPGDPAVRNLHSTVGGTDSILGGGT